MHIYQLLLNSTFVQTYPFDENISEQFVNSDFYVLSSRFEGFGLVIIEAMECGLPVVSFDCKSGPKEIISDGEDGILVNNGDISALADAMTHLMKNSHIRIIFNERISEISVKMVFTDFDTSIIQI